MTAEVTSNMTSLLRDEIQHSNWYNISSLVEFSLLEGAKIPTCCRHAPRATGQKGNILTLLSGQFSDVFLAYAINPFRQ